MCVFQKRAVLRDLTNLGASASNHLDEELAGAGVYDKGSAQ